jgi:hypothetical protein
MCVGVKVNREGRNRIVVLVGQYAIKFPSMRSWRDFLFGMLNNMNEADWHGEHEGYCPVLWRAPLGLAIAMPRASILDDEVFEAIGHTLPSIAGAERKASSWGWLGDRVVAVDYGWR